MIMTGYDFFLDFWWLLPLVAMPGFDSHRYTKTNITNNIIKIQGGQKMV